MKKEQFVDLYEELVTPFTLSNSKYKIRKTVSKEDKESLTCIPAFVGEKYGSGNVKLMLVGRAVNGWDLDWAVKARDIAKQSLSIKFDMGSIDDCPLQNEGTDDEYNFNRCSFIKLGKDIATKLGLQAKDSAANLLWSNLYKVAPSLSGNPNGQVQKIQRQTAIKILMKEIDTYSPTHILFVTDIDWLQYTWRNNKNELNFAKALGIQEDLSINGGNYVKAFGRFENIPYVVCVRPETRKIEDMSKDIVEAYYRV